MDTDAVIKRHNELKTLRQPEEVEWRAIADLIRPENDIRPDEKRKTSRYDYIFDSTGLYALDDFVGGLFGQATNPANRWFSLGLVDDELGEWQPVKAWLWQVTTILLNSAGPGLSSFYEDIPAVFADLGAFGHGVLWSEEDQGRQGFLDRVIPVGQVFFDEGIDGRINTVHREWRARGRQIKAKFGDVPVNDEHEYTIIHAVFANPEAREDRIGPQFMPFRSVYCSQEIKGWRREGGYYELPYHIPRWQRRSGTPYSMGPGHKARPDLNMVNAMERSHIVAAQMAAEPPLLAHDEAVFTVADVYPGAVLYGAMSDAGKQLLAPIARSSQLQLSMNQSEQRRSAIKQAFYFSVLQLIERPQMTASEFLGMSEESLKRMAAHLARLQAGGLSPWVGRRFNMLDRAGQLPPPPPELAGQPMKVVYNSPLAKVQQMADARAAMNWVNGMAPVAQIIPEILDNLEPDGYAQVTHAGFGPPPSILRDPRKRDELRQQRAAASQKAVDWEQTGQAVSIAAEAAHAAQASTLAGGRGGR